MAHFMFEEGEWIGNGVVSFTQSPDVLHFRVKWSIRPTPDNAFQCTQLVEIVGGDQMVNMFYVENCGRKTFDITLENEILGTFPGKGIIDDHIVAWEFRERGTFDGYEVYERQENGYSFQAEYLSSDHARTSIHGTLRKQNERRKDF